MRTLVVAAVAFACGCASEPVDAWVGSYDIQIDERQWPCDDPSAEPFEASSDRTWMLEPVAANAFQVPGLCSFRYDIVTSTRADLAPRSCEVTLDSGARATADVLDGTLNRDGARIWGTQRLTLTLEGGVCVRAAADISGTRF